MSKEDLKTPPHEQYFPDWIKEQRQGIRQKLETLSVTELWIEELIEFGPDIIAEVLAEYQITADFENPLPTYFVPPKKTKKLAKTLHIDEGDFEGYMLATLGIILVMIRGDLLQDAYTYFHETIHALGKVAIWHADGRVVASRVGHSFFRHTEENSADLDRGDFLEESAVDWLAAKATVIFMQRHDHEFLPEPTPERQVVKLAAGLPYLHMRNCLVWLTDELPELERLWLASRFDLKLVPEFSKKLSQQYGQGALHKLNHLSTADPFDSDKTVMSLRPFER